jgi:hypothetical protein
MVRFLPFYLGRYFDIYTVKEGGVNHWMIAAGLILSTVALLGSFESASALVLSLITLLNFVKLAYDRGLFEQSILKHKY